MLPVIIILYYYEKEKDLKMTFEKNDSDFAFHYSLLNIELSDN